MPIRAKLLVLLLVIALPPLLAIAWFDQQAARRLGIELSERARTLLQARATEEMLLTVRNTAHLLQSRQDVLEISVRLQARGVERVLRDVLPPEAESVTVATSGGSETERGRLAALAPYVARLRLDLAEPVLWHRVVLDSGAHAVFPAPPDGIGAPPEWWPRLRDAADRSWVGPLSDPATGRQVMVIGEVVRDREGRTIGVTSVEIPVSAVLEAAQQQIPGQAAPALVMADAQGLRVLAASETALLENADETVLQAVLADMTAGNAGVRRLDVGGQDSIWAYHPIDGGVYLLSTLSFAAVTAEAMETEVFLAERIENLQMVAWGAVALFIPLLVVLAVLASRHVTLPIAQLNDAARRLMAGDFEARTNIRSGDELQALGRLFNIMVPQLRERMHMRDSLALAQGVQQNLLPARPPRVQGFDVAGQSIYCDETGGDYYDWFELGPRRLAVAVGDVSGHGIAAALLMTTVRALLHARRPEAGRLAEQLEAINRQLVTDAHAGRFMTLFMTVLDDETRSIHWVGAGHEPALLYDPLTQRFREVDGPDIPLGVDMDWHYTELSSSGWAEGTVLLLGTDGVRETRSPGGEMFGRDRLQDVLRRNAGKPAQDILDSILAALRDFRAKGVPSDDVTLVVVKAAGGAG
ncbi:SpoIIE family protein phosphatase [Telmatospirillum sp. J64-1]|uniref:SpoIIE family protein phosphatase n=1 Tax=Telmatospirillum sp. J64-1 TaxID=2502183 RepID=UPI00115C6A7D|nr:SpoIIE family protein phosphatase [Telmatospirillum sp. J64-1]